MTSEASPAVSACLSPGILVSASSEISPCEGVSFHHLSLCLSLSASVSSEIRDQLKEEEINIYQFPDCDSDEDEDFKRQDAEMKVQRTRREARRRGGGRRRGGAG